MLAEKAKWLDALDLCGSWIVATSVTRDKIRETDHQQEHRHYAHPAANGATEWMHPARGVSK